MDILTGIILGVVQGLTEFLPVSSSGHLVLARELLGQQVDYGLAVDAILQLATILAVFVFFFRDFMGLIRDFFRWLFQMDVDPRQKRMIAALVLGTVPIVVFGLLFENFMGTALRDPWVVAFTLVAGSLLFWLAERVARQDRDFCLRSGIGIGLFQVLAIIPGFSRSGATVSAGLIFGMRRVEAARFSFLLAFPAIFGSGMKKMLELQGSDLLVSIGTPLILGFATSFVVGLVSIHFLLRYLRKHTLHAFALYRVLLASVTIALLLLR